MTRLRIFFLFAAMLALATAFSACGGDNSDESPKTVLDNATFEGVESGNLDLSLGIGVKGSEGGNVDISLAGPFQSEDGAKTPELDLTAKASGSVGGEDIDFEGGLVLLPGRAFVNYEGVDYEVDSTTYSFVESAIKQAQSENGSEGQTADAAACQEAAAGLKIGNFVDNLSDGGSADVDGTSTTKVSGDLDVPGAIDAVLELTEDPACKAQMDAATRSLPSGPQLKEAKDTVGKMIKSAHIDVYVGDDDIVRRVSAQLALDATEGKGDSGAERVDLDLDLSLTGVNEEQSISAPGKTRPLSQLFVKLGINPIELAGALQGGGIGSLLESFDAPSGGSGGKGAGGGGQSYADCIRSADTAADLQKCVP